MQRLKEKLENSKEARQQYEEWLKNPMTQLVIEELRMEGEPVLLPFNIVNKDMSTFLLGVYSGWFSAIRMITDMGKVSLVKEIESKYNEEM